MRVRDSRPGTLHSVAGGRSGRGHRGVGRQPVPIPIHARRELDASTWDTPLPSKPPPHAPMAKVYRCAVHERAAPDNAMDPAGLALANRSLGDASFTEGPMEPDTPNATLVALADNFNRNFRVGGDYDSIDGPGNSNEIWVAPHAFDLRCVCVAWPGGARVAARGVGREAFAPLTSLLQRCSRFKRMPFCGAVRAAPLDVEGPSITFRRCTRTRLGPTPEAQNPEYEFEAAEAERLPQLLHSLLMVPYPPLPRPEWAHRYGRVPCPRWSPALSALVEEAYETADRDSGQERSTHSHFESYSGPPETSESNR